MVQITLDHIAHAYDPTRRSEDDYALKPMSHVWQNGLAYALLGPSGCGKTTLLNVISGLVIPSEGRLLFDAEDVTTLPTERRNIAQVFQFPVIYDTMTVGQNLAFPLRNRGVDRATTEKRVKEIADMLGLTQDLGRRARGLTAAAKQKISLGRGLVRFDVSALLLDEPLTVIDPALKWELRSSLKRVHHALELPMIYVTHDQTEALTFADRLVVMKDGRVLQIGTPTELFERPEHTFVGYFIGSPGMNLLPAQLRGNRAVLAGGSEVELGAWYPEQGAGADIKLGIRPDFVTVSQEGSLVAQVRRVEDLGRVQLARVLLDGHEVVATLPPGARIDGSEARLHFDPANTLIYANEHLVQRRTQ